MASVKEKIGIAAFFVLATSMSYLAIREPAQDRAASRPPIRASGRNYCKEADLFISIRQKKLLRAKQKMLGTDLNLQKAEEAKQLLKDARKLVKRTCRKGKPEKKTDIEQAKEAATRAERITVWLTSEAGPPDR